MSYIECWELRSKYENGNMDFKVCLFKQSWLDLRKTSNYNEASPDLLTWEGLNAAVTAVRRGLYKVGTYLSLRAQHKTMFQRQGGCCDYVRGIICCSLRKRLWPTETPSPNLLYDKWHMRETSGVLTQINKQEWWGLGNLTSRRKTNTKEGTREWKKGEKKQMIEREIWRECYQTASRTVLKVIT